MNHRPTLLRARIYQELASKPGRAMTASQIREYTVRPRPGQDIQDVLLVMVSDGLLRRVMVPRMNGHQSLPAYALATASTPQTIGGGR